jgi:integrase
MSNRKELGALAVGNIHRRGINFVGGVTGLAVNVIKSGSRSWVLRYQVGGKRRDMGLGGYPDVTLAQAKERARVARSLLAQGLDPIEHSRAARSKMISERATALTFSQAADQYIETHESTWRNAKHAQQWRNTIAAYATPAMGKVLVRDVDLPQVLSVLEPIWKTKTETASRLRGRLESVLDWATARGYRSGPNPARWKGLLDKLLPAPGKIAKTDHHRALPFADLPAFMKLLAVQDGLGARALEFTILTACRSGEVRGAKWDEFDLDAGIWTVPESRMKAGKEHRVPLSDAAMVIVRTQKEYAFCEYVFPSSHRARNSESEGAPLSDMTLSAVLRRMKVAAVPHGFRSTFRDWCAEVTDYPRDVAEMALAHAIGNKVEAAYRRGDLFEKRNQLMQDWANFAQS